VLIDSHVHLQPHGEKPPVNRALIEAYVASACRQGLGGVAITEHLFRFREAYDLLAGWWDADPSPALAAATRSYWEDHVSLSLPEYARLIETAKRDGLPVLLGLEMDWIPGRAEALRSLLAPYAWDVVLGSVHWIGAVGFDIEESPEEWVRRGVDTVFREYAQLVEELAGSGLADVLAHPDLPKLWGHTPSDLAGFEAAIVSAAVRGGCAIEVNTNGLRKRGGIYPSSSLLRVAHAAGLPATLASDAHTPERVGEAFDVAREHLRAAGYEQFLSFAGRVPCPQAL
jgi:histidinol-phosphatase (PHP family)